MGEAAHRGSYYLASPSHRGTRSTNVAGQPWYPVGEPSAIDPLPRLIRLHPHASSGTADGMPRDRVPRPSRMSASRAAGDAAGPASRPRSATTSDGRVDANECPCARDGSGVMVQAAGEALRPSTPRRHGPVATAVMRATQATTIHGVPSVQGRTRLTSSTIRGRRGRRVARTMTPEDSPPPPRAGARARNAREPVPATQLHPLSSRRSQPSR